MLACNAGAKTAPAQVIENSGEEVASVIQATDVARMRSFQDFLSEGESADRLRGGKQRDGCRENRNEIVENSIVLTGSSDSLVFRLMCEGPASATVCAGSARRVRIRCPISSKAQIQALACVECIGC